MRLSSRFSFPIAGLFFLAISGVSQAANIHIDDTNPSGSITISWSDFEFGFTVNDRSFTFPGYSIVQSVTVTPTPTLPRVTFSGSWISTSGSGGGATLYFVDPGTNHVRDSL